MLRDGRDHVGRWGIVATGLLAACFTFLARPSARWRRELCGLRLAALGGIAGNVLWGLRTSKHAHQDRAEAEERGTSLQ
jgi:uncharacterized membrane protein YebE (DUF533 family)